MDLNARAKAIKFLEENLGINLCDLGQTLRYDTKSTRNKRIR